MSQPKSRKRYRNGRPISARFPDDIAGKLDKLAVDSDRSVASVVRLLVLDGLGRNPGKVVGAK